MSSWALPRHPESDSRGRAQGSVREPPLCTVHLVLWRFTDGAFVQMEGKTPPTPTPRWKGDDSLCGGGPAPNPVSPQSACTRLL